MSMTKEPAVIVGTAVAVVVAVLALLVSFGIDISEDQRTAIVGVVAVLAPLVSGLVTRAKVFAPATVADIKADLT